MGDHGTRLNALQQEGEQARADALREVAQDPVFGEILLTALTRNNNDPEFDEMMQQVDRVCEQVEDMYKNTNATASECLDHLMNELPGDMEPDCIQLCQTLMNLVADEEEWDGLTAEEQAERDHVPKGKKRKALSKKRKSKRNNVSNKK